MVEDTVGIISERLNIVTKSSHQLERRDLIFSLLNEGLTQREIADHLNDLGIEKPRGGTYSKSDVGMSIMKWRKREERKEVHTHFLKSVRVVFLK